MEKVFAATNQIWHELGYPTGEVMCSGYCKYPLYQFDRDKLAEYCLDGILQHEYIRRRDV